MRLIEYCNNDSNFGVSPNDIAKFSVESTTFVTFFRVGLIVHRSNVKIFFYE